MSASPSLTGAVSSHSRLIARPSHARAIAAVGAVGIIILPARKHAIRGIAAIGVSQRIASPPAGSAELRVLTAWDSHGRTTWIVDAHRDDGKRFMVRADEKVTAFLELEAAIRTGPN